jgi:esterase/lipase
MMSRQSPAWFLRPAVMLLFAAGLLTPAMAQDIQGLEVCTAEKQMDRRTGCLQANVEYLQRAIGKLANDTENKIAATERELAAARNEVAELKAIVEKLKIELTQTKAKADNGKK